MGNTVRTSKEFDARATDIFDAPGRGETRTRVSTIQEISSALAAQYDAGRKLGAIEARELALREVQHVIAGLRRSLGMHEVALQKELDSIKR